MRRGEIMRDDAADPAEPADLAPREQINVTEH
jgi:hypothetical protein